MRRIINSLMIVIMLLANSCSKHYCENKEFKDFYYKKVKIIVEYNKNSSTIGRGISMDEWFLFYETTSYLSFLTDHEFLFASGEPPFYRNNFDFIKDISFLNDWFDANMCLSIREADSIVNAKENALRNVP